MEKKLFCAKEFSPLKISSGPVENSSGNPAIKFFVKKLRSYCSQSSKKKEIDKYSKSHFLK